jgi:hypothetical protein
MSNVEEEMEHLHIEESQTGKLGTLKGVRPVRVRLSRNLRSKEGKARLLQSI